MRVWVTRANCFIGRRLVRVLADRRSYRGIGHGAIEDADRERIGLREWLNSEINGKACGFYLASTMRDHPPRTRAANSGATFDKRMRGILISLVRCIPDWGIQSPRACQMGVDQSHNRSILGLRARFLGEIMQMPNGSSRFRSTSPRITDWADRSSGI